MCLADNGKHGYLIRFPRQTAPAHISTAASAIRCCRLRRSLYTGFWHQGILSRAAYVVLGITTERYREILSITVVANVGAE